MIDKQRWNLRLWRGSKEDAVQGPEILPWTPVIVDDMPNMSDDYKTEDDDPRSFVMHLSWNKSLDSLAYKTFNEWIVESLKPELMRKAGRRRPPTHCMGEMNRGKETRFINYVYLEEITFLPLDFIDIGLVEAKAILDYRSMTKVPTMVYRPKHLED